MIKIIDDKIKKTFDYKDEDNQSFLKNEVFWLNYLKGKWVPELLEVGNNYVVMKTCQTSSWFCKGLKVGNNPNADEVNRPCKGGSGSASNSSYHFAFHFNYSGMKNPYGLEGPTGSYGGWIKDQCCLMQSWDPKPKGRTHIWQTYPESKIKVKTNIGDDKGNDKYLYTEIDWPYGGFR